MIIVNGCMVVEVWNNLCNIKRILLLVLRVSGNDFIISLKMVILDNIYCDYQSVVIQSSVVGGYNSCNFKMIFLFIYCSDSWMINKICKLMGIVNSNYSLFMFVLLDGIYYFISLCYFGDLKF